MTFDGSLHVLIAECKTLANGLSAENLDSSAAEVWNAMQCLRRALSPQAKAEIDRMDRERLERLRAA